MKETRKQKEARRKGAAADRAFDPIRRAMDAGDLTMHVCGGRLCSVTQQPHDMSRWLTFKGGGSLACKDCGITAMDLDLMGPELTAGERT